MDDRRGRAGEVSSTSPGGRAASPSLGRRAFLASIGGAAGLVAARGFGVGGLLGRDPASLSPEQALVELARSLSPRQRELVLLPADHPSRQVTNTVAVLDRPQLGLLLDARQLGWVDRMLDGMLSERGRDDFAATFAFEGRPSTSVLAIYGDPAEGPAQATVSGGHLTLRLGTDGRGGALAYGGQIGNGRYRVKGNAFASHSEVANRFMRALEPSQRARARSQAPASEHLLQPLAAGARFRGVAWSGLSPAAREASEELLAAVLGTFAPGSVRSLDPAALHLSVYDDFGFYPDMKTWSELSPAERAERGDPYWQVWRIEGPDVVIHFQGAPHVHAYVEVTEPGKREVGSGLARVDRIVDGEAMRRLLEGALRRATGEQLAFHPDEIPGRFCPGEITTGTAWTLDPFGNRVVVAEVAGRAMAAGLRDRLMAQGHSIADGQRYRIATHAYAASDEQTVGSVERVESLPLELREAIIDHIRAGALESA